MADRLIRGLALLCFALPAVAGSGLADPTRPPLALTAEPVVEGEVAAPVLQSVMIPKKGKPVAMIGGQQVMLGGKYGDSRLTALSEREAVLTGPDGTVRLFLTPGIEKINIIAKTPAVRRGQGKGKP